MLHIGHFTFDEIGTGQEIRHGYFSTVVDADNIEPAVTEFKELILSMKKMEDTFQRIAAVYLEDIIEFQQLPEKATVSRVQSSAGEFPESITHSLPGIANPGIRVYGLEADVRATENELNTDEFKESKPFIKF
jgi:hypothetical protein